MATGENSLLAFSSFWKLPVFLGTWHFPLFSKPEMKSWVFLTLLHWGIVNILKISKSRTENHLHKLGYINCFDVSVLHKLRKKSLLDHISTCNSLIQCIKNIMLLKQIFTGDENWILYNNVGWGKQNEPRTTTLKSSLHWRSLCCI